jgi:hypothetical protein
MMSRREESVLMNLDRLRQLIKNMREDGKITDVQPKIDYYNDVIQRTRIKEILEENNRTDHQLII